MQSVQPRQTAARGPTDRAELAAARGALPDHEMARSVLTAAVVVEDMAPIHIRQAHKATAARAVLVRTWPVVLPVLVVAAVLVDAEPQIHPKESAALADCMVLVVVLVATQVLLTLVGRFLRAAREPRASSCSAITRLAVAAARCFGH